MTEQQIAETHIIVTMAPLGVLVFILHLTIAELTLTPEALAG